MNALPAYTVEDIRTAEDRLFATIPEPDYLMRQAAHAVAVAAQHMLHSPDPTASRPTSLPTAELDDAALQGSQPRVLLLVGPGGNGGDALYAGAFLQQAGIAVSALLLAESVHERALAAFSEAGGQFTTQPIAVELVIDGLYGIGGRAGLPTEILKLWRQLQDLAQAQSHKLQLLAVDILSGVAADTGEAGNLDPSYRADVTVTFGGLRIAHALSARCGQVLLADLHGGADDYLSAALASVAPNPQVHFSQVVETVTGAWPQPLHRASYEPLQAQLEPQEDDDKYSGGVVGICAGSAKYIGAALLCAGAAVRTTRSMVRYVGTAWQAVVQQNPEIVSRETLAQSGRVQAWVYGPGSDDSPGLPELLASQTALLIDADGITALSRDPGLLESLQQRAAFSLLTPHAGEAQRLVDALGLELDSKTQRLQVAQQLAAKLQCVVLLKGRKTLIATPSGQIHAIEAGHSRAATAGSGDILAGICGAWMAQAVAQEQDLVQAVVEATIIHAQAAYLAGETARGIVPVHASAINENVGLAVAICSQHGSTDC